MVNAQTWLDRNYPKKSRNKIKDLNLSKKRSASEKEKLTGCLDLTDFINLEKFDCSGNKITEIKLIDLNNLREIACDSNKLTSLDFLANCLNLKKLWIGNNSLTSSLKPLANLTQLITLDLDYNPEIKADLQYLPNSLEFFGFEDNLLIIAQLLPHRNDLLAWQNDYYKRIGKLDKIIELGYKIVSETASPKVWDEDEYSVKTEGMLSTQLSFEKLSYQKFLLESNDLSLFQPQQLPLRLLNITNNQVVDSELILTNSNYVILSYSWGDLSDRSNLITWDYTYRKSNGEIESKQIGVNKEFNAIGTTEQSVKALKKARAAVDFLNEKYNANIDYLWMDQMCINQFDNKEQEREVPKMKQYYYNSSITLINIDRLLGGIEIDWSNKEKISQSVEKIIRIITNDQWFTRAWTFQEGVLSRQTIFMFDDCLVDGQFLAYYWGKKEHFDRYWSDWYSPGERITYLTPLGISYGLSASHNFSLTLNQALVGVGNRQQTILVDKVYSTLGLLTYGDKVKVHYKPHGEKYNQDDLQSAILSVIKTQVKYQGTIEICQSGNYNIGNFPYLIPELQNNRFSKEYLEFKGTSLVMNIHDQFITFLGLLLVIDRVEKRDIWSKGLKLSSWEWQDYSPQIGDNLIIVEGGNSQRPASILIRTDQFKVLSLIKNFDHVMEVQPLLLTYQNNQLKVYLDEDLNKKISAKSDFLTVMKGQLEDLFDQNLIERFFLSPESIKMADLKRNYKYENWSDGHQEIWLNQYKDAYLELKHLQTQYILYKEKTKRYELRGSRDLNSKEENLVCQVEQLSIN